MSLSRLYLTLINHQQNSQFADFLGLRDVDLVGARSSLSITTPEVTRGSLGAPEVEKGENGLILRIVFFAVFVFVRVVRLPFWMVNYLLLKVEDGVGGGGGGEGGGGGGSEAENDDGDAGLSTGYEIIEKPQQKEVEQTLPKHELMSTQMTPAAKDLYDLISPLIKNAGKMPLYVIPPGAVSSFCVEKPGPQPGEISWRCKRAQRPSKICDYTNSTRLVICINLNGRYQRFIRDVKPGVGEVTFDVTFTETIRGKFDKTGCLVDLEGVLAKRLPLQIQARVTKMILPKVGEDKVTFVAKVSERDERTYEDSLARLNEIHP